MATLGQTLRHAREIRGLALQEAAIETNIQSVRLDALERDDFSRLPPPTYVKGFIRIYAKYLGLEAEPLVQEYVALHAPKEVVPSMSDAPAPTPRKSAPGRNPPADRVPGLKPLSGFQKVMRQMRRHVTPKIAKGLIFGVIGLVAFLIVGKIFTTILAREPDMAEDLGDVPSSLVRLPPEPYFESGTAP